MLLFETTISHNGYLKSERAAGPSSGIKSKRLLCFFFPPLVSCPFFLSGLSRCRAISQLTQESMSHVHPRPFERGSHFAAHLGKHLPSSSVVPRGDEGGSREKSGFCNQSHMLGRTASCKTRKIFVANTSAWLSSHMPVCQRRFAGWTPVQL